MIHVFRWTLISAIFVFWYPSKAQTLIQLREAQNIEKLSLNGMDGFYSQTIAKGTRSNQQIDLQLSIKRPGFYDLRFLNSTTSLYLRPGDTVVIIETNSSLDFKGENSALNAALLELSRFGYPNFNGSTSEYLSECFNTYTTKTNTLKSIKLSQSAQNQIFK